LLELPDYLDLTFATASAQWRGIVRREYVPKGERQEDFTPVETLLCFGLGLVGNRSKSGNINIPESSPTVKRLGELFKRSPGSLALKLANLDGRRAHRAKHEQRLWIKLTSDRFQFEALYALILEAGRSVGLDEEELPDFLGVEDNRLQIVFEADSVSDDDLLASLEGDFATRDRTRIARNGASWPTTVRPKGADEFRFLMRFLRAEHSIGGASLVPHAHRLAHQAVEPE